MYKEIGVKTFMSWIIVDYHSFTEKIVYLGVFCFLVNKLSWIIEQLELITEIGMWNCEYSLFSLYLLYAVHLNYSYLHTLYDNFYFFISRSTWAILFNNYCFICILSWFYNLTKFERSTESRKSYIFLCY